MDSEKLVEVNIVEVSIDKTNQSSIVVLREKDGDRWFPIHVGPIEAHTITYILSGATYTRPLTFDTIVHILEALGGVVVQIVITEMRDSTFFSTIELIREDGATVLVDARPSDAIPLALKLGLPIHVTRKVIDEIGRSGEPEVIDRDEKISELKARLKVAVEAEQYEKAARLRDLISELQNDQND